MIAIVREGDASTITAERDGLKVTLADGAELLRVVLRSADGEDEGATT